MLLFLLGLRLLPLLFQPMCLSKIRQDTPFVIVERFGNFRNTTSVPLSQLFVVYYNFIIVSLFLLRGLLLTSWPTWSRSESYAESMDAQRPQQLLEHQAYQRGTGGKATSEQSNTCVFSVSRDSANPSGRPRLLWWVVV